MHTWIEIDGGALAHNYHAFCNKLGKKSVAPVLKSNAYGHGLDLVASLLKHHSPEWVAFNYLEEALQVKENFPKSRLVVLGPVFSEELPNAQEAGIEVFIANQTVLDSWLALEKKPKIHLKFDTGMSRQGFLPEDAALVSQRVKPHKELIVGIGTHFANVEDVLEYDYALQQLSQFKEATSHFENFPNITKHASSSASSLILDESLFDMSRIGISLYGHWPSASTRLSYLQLQGELFDLKPALSWHTKVATVKKVRKNQYIGYGCTFQANTDLTVAVLPVGYFEGYPRIASNNSSYVLIHGHRCPILGRICMNMMTVDITHLPHVKEGDQVTLIGENGDETITAEMVADWSQTIQYEIVTRLNKEIPRRLKAI